MNVRGVDTDASISQKHVALGDARQRLSVRTEGYDGNVGTNFVPPLSKFLDPDREQRKERARQKSEGTDRGALEVFQGVWKDRETESEVGMRPGRMIRVSQSD